MKLIQMHTMLSHECIGMVWSLGAKSCASYASEPSTFNMSFSSHTSNLQQSGRPVHSYCKPCKLLLQVFICLKESRPLFMFFSSGETGVEGEGGGCFFFLFPFGIPCQSWWGGCEGWAASLSVSSISFDLLCFYYRQKRWSENDIFPFCSLTIRRSDVPKMSRTVTAGTVKSGLLT